MFDSACKPTTLPCPDHGDACLWLDDSLRALHVNAAGWRLLATHPELLVLEDGVLRVLTTSPRWPQALARALRGERAALTLPTPQRSQLSLLLEPGGAVVPAGTLLLRCRPHRLQRIDLHVARQLFDLTMREAEVAAALAEGHTTAAIAVRVGVQTNTVQAHAKAAMTKIGVSRQAELVATLWRSVAALPAGVADPSTAEPATEPATQPATQPAAQPAAQPTTQPAAQPTAQLTAQPTSEAAWNHTPRGAGDAAPRKPDLAYVGKDNGQLKKQTAAGQLGCPQAITEPMPDRSTDDCTLAALGLGPAHS